MNKQVYLWRDQYGTTLHASTVKELRNKVGGGRVSKMFIDKSDGTTVHCGYVIGPSWFTKYARVEIPL